MLSKKIVIILSSLTILALLLGGLVYYNMAQAQNNNVSYYYNFMITVVPESPTTDDNVSVSFSFDLASVSYSANFSPVSSVGNDFSITIDIYIPHGIILPAIYPVEETYDLGELVDGLYSLYAEVQVLDEDTGLLLDLALYSESFAVKPVWKYDPWNDLNNDGTINILDISALAVVFGSSGASINKTELLLRMETHIFQSGRLLHLPTGATQRPPIIGRSPHEQIFVDTILHSLDLNQTELGNQQSVFVRKGVTITVTGVFQIYDNPNPSGIRQAFFIYSWTPSWPPPSEDYYHELYNGVPGSYPGTGMQSFTFDLTIPNEIGVYYLYFAGGAEYSMEEAVVKYTEPLWAPYATIVVGH